MLTGLNGHAKSRFHAAERADMQTKDLPDWAAFEEEIRTLRAGTERPFSPLLFRGQNDSDLRLRTTLERKGCDGMSFIEYYRLVVTRIMPAVETFTGTIWNVPDFGPEIEKAFREDRELLGLRTFPTVEFCRYLVYLRHHGFPSPLLDWSYSPYVAAFFAFKDEPNSKPKQRSIYVYCEWPKGVKGDFVGEAIIRPTGSYVRSHPRHFRQQSDYTFCGRFESDKGWCFHPHESVLGHHPGQDLLWKFNLPSTHRIEVLRFMNDYNLNAFSLFDTEEALLETMWFREHVLKAPG
jgi:hypothetical protein